MGWKGQPGTCNRLKETERKRRKMGGWEVKQLE